MYIAPNSTIRFLSSCPLDSGYGHTLYFSSRTAQTNYFAALMKYELEDQSYQRLTSGVIRARVSAENLYDCNYIMFKNTSFENKWFYCFITSIEYVNNSVCEVRYKMDVMQTWFFDFTLEECYVEREHQATDAIGSNLLAEPVELGEYVYSSYSTTNKMGARVIVVATNEPDEGEYEGGGLYSNIFSGVYYRVFTPTLSAANGIPALRNYLTKIGWDNLFENIISVFMYDDAFVSVMDNGSGVPGSGTKYYTIEKTKQLSNIDGYVPRNNKLFTYPYNFIMVSNNSGQSAIYHYEQFSNSTMEFQLAGDFSCNPQVMLTPQDYKGVAFNYNEKISMDGYPQCTFNIDSFKAWLAQTASNMSIDGLTGAVAGGSVGASVGGLGGAAIGLGVAGAASAFEGMKAAMKPPEVKGTQAPSTLYAMGLKDFGFYKTSIQAQFARRIDDFFDMYGYATNRVKKPNISGRPQWNYVKTRNCTITGNIPSDDEAEICAIHDKGVTYWKNGNNVGNYSLNNRPS